MAVMVGGWEWVWVWVCARGRVWVLANFGGSREQAIGRDCLLETVVEVWKLASVPADRTAWDRPVDGKGKEKWILLSLMVRLRGKGYDVACPGNLAKETPSSTPCYSLPLSSRCRLHCLPVP